MPRNVGVLYETALISINNVLSICQRSQNSQTAQVEALDPSENISSVRLTGFGHWSGRDMSFDTEILTLHICLSSSKAGISRGSSGLSLKVCVYYLGKVLVPKLLWVEVDWMLLNDWKSDTGSFNFNINFPYFAYFFLTLKGLVIYTGIWREGKMWEKENLHVTELMADQIKTHNKFENLHGIFLTLKLFFVIK